MTAVGSSLFFEAGDPDAGNELWKTKGSGGYRVADIRPGPANADPRELTRVGKRLFFTADDGTHDRELWMWKP